MIKKGGKSEHFFVTHKHFLNKISIILVLFWQKKALLLAFNAFFTSTFGKSLHSVVITNHNILSTVIPKTLRCSSEEH